MFEQLYVFGASLSDSGNIFTVSTTANQILPTIPVTPPSPPYFEGRFANGPIWVDDIALNLGLTLVPATTLAVGSAIIVTPTGDLGVNSQFNGATTAQNVNFAFGGAQTGQNATGEFGEALPGVLRQVDWYLEDLAIAGASANPNALYIVWAGANDYQTIPNPDPQQTVNNLVSAVEQLYNAGARHIVLPNLPDVGKTPQALSPDAPVASETLTEVVNLHNDLLSTAWSQLEETLPELNLIPLDSNSLFDQVLNFPAAFGLTNTTEPCLDFTTVVPCETPETTVFWDVIHPTTVTHQILANYAQFGLHWYLEPTAFTLLTETNDTVTLTETQTADQLVLGLGGNDTIIGTENSDRIYGNQDSDILVGNGGNDVLRGGKDRDFLFGAGGDDLLIGDLGDEEQNLGDALKGGPGNDVFLLQGNDNAPDVLIDFNPDEDSIGLTDGLTFEALTLTPLSQLSIPEDLQSNPALQLILSQGLITITELDPDQDGLLNGTSLSLGEQTIAIALNQSPEAFSGRFLTFPTVNSRLS